MKIMDSFGAGGSFTEYYAMDFQRRCGIDVGHDGPGAISGSRKVKTKVRPLGVYHGKVGSGLSVEMSVKNGPVTLLSVVEKRDGGLFLLVAEGESVAGPILQIGNTNSRYRFSIGARRFVNNWNIGMTKAHHWVLPAHRPYQHEDRKLLAPCSALRLYASADKMSYLFYEHEILV